MSEPIRLSKRVVELARCSRSQAEQLIEGGWVKVDGQVVEKPQFLVSDERVDIDPDAQPGPIEPATILLHRPALEAGDPSLADPVLTAGQRSPDDRTGVRLVQRHLRHLTPIVPLEAAASGLVILTQNEGLAQAMRRDGGRLEQEFLVDVTGDPPAGLGALARGFGLDQGAPRARVSWQSEQRLRFALKGVQPGELTRACEAVGLTVVSLRRVRLGRVPLAKLPAGQWRYLDRRERI